MYGVFGKIGVLRFFCCSCYSATVRFYALLFLIVDSLDAGGDAGEDFVGDGAGGAGYLLQEGGVAEDGHFVVFGAIDSGDVEEAHVHADVADDGHKPAVDEHLCVAVAQMAVEAVGIADGGDSDARGALRHPRTVVAHAVALRDVFELRDAGFEGADGLETALHGRLGRKAVEAYAETHHVVLRFGEPLDAGGVEYVEQYVAFAEGVAQGVGPQAEPFELQSGEVVGRGVVGAGQMGEDGTHGEGAVGIVEPPGQLVEVGLGKAEAVHAGVELDVDGHGLLLFSEGAHGVGEEVEDAEAVDVGFEAVADDVGKALLLGVHDHDGEGDAVAAQIDALVAIGHGEVIDMVVLQDAGHLGLAGAVGGCLDHRHEAGAGTDEGAVVVEVGNEVVEVDLHDGLVRFALKEARDVLEMEAAGAFEQDGLVVETVDVVLVDEVFGGVEEGGIEAGEEVAVAFKGFAYADEAADAVGSHKGRHLGVEVGLGDSGLEYVAYDK